MELQTHTVDRMLEALAPSLAAELDRAIQEVRQQLEDDFQNRLQSALRDAELETLHHAEVRLEEAVIEAREAMRVQLSDGFAEHLNQTVQLVRDGLKAKSDGDMQAAYANWASERTLLQEQLSQWHAYAEAQRLLSECSSQPEILSRFLKLSEPFAESLAIYISKSDGLALWKARGNSAFPELISPDTTDPELYFRPVVLRSKLIAAVSAVRPCNVESLDFLMSCFERAVEIFGLKMHSVPPRAPEPEAGNG